MKWNAELIERLNALHKKGMTAQEMATELGVTIHAVKAALYRQQKSGNLHRRQKYTKWDAQLENTVAEMLKNSHSLSDIAESLNISYASLTSKMRRLNLTFHENVMVNGLTPKTIIENFHISESQIRQFLNNRKLKCEMRGKHLLVTKEAIYEWLSDGYAVRFPPRDKDGEWMLMWHKALRNTFRNFASMEEISWKFKRSKMSITYYGKKKGFPPVKAHLNSMHTYDRVAVNEWAEKNHCNLLPEIMEETWFKYISGPSVYDLYQETKDKYVLTSQ